MGRAMIIICAGVLVSLGYVSFGTNQQAKQVIGTNAGYAEIVQAKNAAHTGIQIVMQEISEKKAQNDGTDWWDNHYNEGTAWEKDINSSTVKVYAEVIEEAPDNADYWQPDVIRLVSTANYTEPATEAKESTRIVSVYRTNAIDDFVPDFEGAMSVETKNASPNFQGNAKVRGNDASGTCGDKPAITVPPDMPPSRASEFENAVGNLKEQNGGVSSDSDNDYEATSEMIERLESSGNATYVRPDEPNSDNINYKGSLGTADQPGVYIVDQDVKLTGGINEGYGILIIRDADMYADSSGTAVSIAGNFTFNGLVLFENVDTFNGAGTPDINGTVIVGHSNEEYEEDINRKIDVNLTGDITLQYDCKGEDYAKMAAAMAVQHNRFRRLSTFE